MHNNIAVTFPEMKQLKKHSQNFMCIAKLSVNKDLLTPEFDESLLKT